MGAKKNPVNRSVSALDLSRELDNCLDYGDIDMDNVEKKKSKRGLLSARKVQLCIGLRLRWIKTASM